MEKIYETKMHYKGFWNCDSICGVEVYKKDKTIVVVFTELDDNPGTSITNVIEHLATAFKNVFLKNVPREQIIWIEHYPPNPHVDRGDTYDQVDFSVSLGSDGVTVVYKNPKWRRIKWEEFASSPLRTTL